MLLNVGAFFSNFIVGTLGEKVGWHYGFTAAGIGMMIGLVFYLYKKNAWLRPKRLSRTETEATAVDSAAGFSVRHRALVWLLAAGLCIAFWVVYNQHSGLQALMIFGDVDRTLMGFEIPATWFQSLTSFFSFFLAPLLAAMLLKRAQAGRAVLPHQQLMVGFLFAALYCLLSLGAIWERDASAIAQASALWIVCAFLVLTIAELLIAPTGFTIASRLSPPRLAALLMGIWFLNDAVAGLVAGRVGALAYVIGDAALMTALAVFCVACALIARFSDALFRHRDCMAQHDPRRRKPLPLDDARNAYGLAGCPPCVHRQRGAAPQRSPGRGDQAPAFRC